MSAMPPPPSDAIPPGYVPYGSTGFYEQPQYASWSARALGAILNGLFAILFVMPGYVLLSWAGPDDLGTAALVVVLWLVAGITYLALYSHAVGSTGQFWGHRLAGVRIVKDITLEPLGPGRALARVLCGFINSMPLYLGWLLPLWDAKHQTLADKLFGTISIRATPPGVKDQR